jgi:hypothetical protein
LVLGEQEAAWAHEGDVAGGAGVEAGDLAGLLGPRRALEEGLDLGNGHGRVSWGRS